jgi:hypothetical protein
MSAYQPPRPSRVLMALGMATVLGACGNPPAPPPVVLTPIPARPVAATQPAPVAPPAINPLAASEDNIPKYEAHGRRDPFEIYQVRGGSEGLTVASTRLTGIVRNSGSALALVEAPDGIGYILRPGDTLGDGRLMDIGLDNVVFAVVAKPGAPTTRVVLKLAN